jgi:hypothetical protein
VERLQRPEDDADRRAQLVGEQRLDLRAQPKAALDGMRRVLKGGELGGLRSHQAQELAHGQLVTHDIIRHVRVIVIRQRALDCRAGN